MAKETKEDLEKTIAELDYHMKEMQEKLYDNNIETRPTIMQKILARETQLFKTIKYLIEECEKETGREFDIYMCDFKSDATLIAFDIESSGLSKRWTDFERYCNKDCSKAFHVTRGHIGRTSVEKE